MKIAIVGGAPLTKDLAPFDDDSWQIWVLANQLDTYVGKRVDNIFEIHENLEEHGEPEKYLEFVRAGAKDLNAHLVMSPKYAQPEETIFPYTESKALMGSEFLSSSPAYMMAFAILNGATEIGIYGVEMAVDDHEYFKQRPAMFAWIAYAKGRGIKVTIPTESSLFKESYCEGRDWNKEAEHGTFTTEAFRAMEKRHLDKITALKMEIEAHNGAAQAYANMQKVARAVDGGAKNVDLLKSLKVR